jgi:hypothetical protein
MHMTFWEVTDVEGQSFFLPIRVGDTNELVGPFFAIMPPGVKDVGESSILKDILGEGTLVFRAVDRQDLADVMLSRFSPIYPACVMLGDFPIPLTTEGVTLAGHILGTRENPWVDVLEAWGPAGMLAMSTKLLCDVAHLDELH